jgi:hypothetical protein
VTNLESPRAADEKDHVEGFVVHVDQELGAVGHGVVLQVKGEDVLGLQPHLGCHHLTAVPAWGFSLYNTKLMHVLQKMWMLTLYIERL